jgi:ribosomal protein S18 acetylase RimI-like enzyme
MLTLVPARTDQHYEALLELVYHQRSAYLDPLLDLIELTWEQFGNYFRSTGIAYQIILDGKLVGVCWVEERQEVLFLLGLVVKPEQQGLGLGTQALVWLEQNCQASIRAIELQVHDSNPRARKLYERMGYRVVELDRDSGFYLMEKPVNEAIWRDSA